MRTPAAVFLLLNVACLAGCSTASSAQTTFVPAPRVPAPDTGRPSTLKLGYTGFSTASTVRATLQGTPHVLQRSPLVISAVAAGSPAAKAGLAIGDILLAVNGIDSEAVDAETAKWTFLVGARYVIRIRRGDDEREIVLVPIANPAADGAPAHR